MVLRRINPHAPLVARRVIQALLRRLLARAMASGRCHPVARLSIVVFPYKRAISSQLLRRLMNLLRVVTHVQQVTKALPRRSIACPTDLGLNLLAASFLIVAFPCRRAIRSLYLHRRTFLLPTRTSVRQVIWVPRLRLRVNLQDRGLFPVGVLFAIVALPRNRVILLRQPRPFMNLNLVRSPVLQVLRAPRRRSYARPLELGRCRPDVIQTARSNYRSLDTYLALHRVIYLTILFELLRALLISLVETLLVIRLM